LLSTDREKNGLMPSRVTRLGEFSPIGRLLTYFWALFKITIVAQIFGQVFFHGESNVLISFGGAAVAQRSSDGMRKLTKLKDPGFTPQPGQPSLNVLILRQNGLDYMLGDFSKTHPVTLMPSGDQENRLESFEQQRQPMRATRYVDRVAKKYNMHINVYISTKHVTQWFG
jgi:hypothetical protein